MAILSLSQVPILKIGSGELKPAEGPKSIGPLNCNFSTATLFPFEFSTLATQGSFTQILSLFVDNSTVTADTIITFSNGQIIRFPATSQGYVPVLANNPASFTVTGTASSGQANIWGINFLVPSIIWFV